MTAVDELVKMVCYTIWILFVLCANVSDKPLAHFIGDIPCNLVQIIVTFGVTYGYLGGMGIALMRMLYVRFPKWMQQRLVRRIKQLQILIRRFLVEKF